MKIRIFISSVIMALTAVLSAPVHATSLPFDINVLGSPGHNKNLGTGEYDFLGLNAGYGSKFNDFWKFTVASNSIASVSINDLELGFDWPVLADQFHSKGQASSQFNTLKVFDTQYLSFGLFDGSGNLLGRANEDGTLSGLSLFAGEWYTLRVSGKVGGLFGSAYHGVLDISPTPVPLGDTAPLLGSALALLALRFRKRLSTAA